MRIAPPSAHTYACHVWTGRRPCGSRYRRWTSHQHCAVSCCLELNVAIAPIRMYTWIRRNWLYLVSRRPRADGMGAGLATTTAAVTWTTVIFSVRNKVFKLIAIILKDNFCCVAASIRRCRSSCRKWWKMEEGEEIEQSQLVEFYCDEVASLITIYDCVPFGTQIDEKHFICWNN